MEHIKDCIAALREAAPEIDIAENELMRRHTTFAIGGPADLFVQPKTRRELTAALAVLRERNIPFLLLGNGSNMLVADAGIRGAVVCTSELDEVRVNEDNTVSAEAGALLSRIARRAQRSGLTGAEFAGGIPGRDGMVHISKMADHRIEKVEDAVKEGDMVWVKVMEIDDKGRVNLSMKDVKPEEKIL